jgi:hypothetical protein
MIYFCLRYVDILTEWSQHQSAFWLQEKTWICVLCPIAQDPLKTQLGFVYGTLGIVWCVKCP